jgi:two-component system OmpR family response regulator
MNILLIEDDAVLADDLYTLTDSGYASTSATTGAYAEHLLQAQGFALLCFDCT